MLDHRAMLSTITEGRIILVEGPLDCLKLAEAGILNVMASLGADLSDAQAGRIRQIAETLDIPPKALVWYDRDAAGTDGQDRALKTLQEAGIEAEGFDWSRIFTSNRRGGVGYPDAIQDPCDFLAWHPDRLSRNALEAGMLIQMLDDELIKDLAFPAYNFHNDTSGKEHLTIEFARAKGYTDRLSEVILRGVSGREREGAMIYPVKFGYRSRSPPGSSGSAPEPGSPWRRDTRWSADRSRRRYR